MANLDVLFATRAFLPKHTLFFNLYSNILTHDLVELLFPVGRRMSLVMYVIKERCRELSARSRLTGPSNVLPYANQYTVIIIANIPMTADT